MPDSDVRRWRLYLTFDLRERFESFGEEQVRSEVARRGYDRPETHAAALAWLHEKERGRKARRYWFSVSLTLIAAAAAAWRIPAAS